MAYERHSGVLFVDEFNREQCDSFFDKHSMFKVASPGDANARIRERIVATLGMRPGVLKQVSRTAGRHQPVDAANPLAVDAVERHIEQQRHFAWADAVNLLAKHPELAPMGKALLIEPVLGWADAGVGVLFVDRLAPALGQFKTFVIDGKRDFRFYSPLHREAVERWLAARAEDRTVD